MRAGRVSGGLEFQITPTEDGFDERLTAVDGEAPRASLVRQHREKARFTERYREAQSEDAWDRAIAFFGRELGA